MKSRKFKIICDACMNPLVYIDGDNAGIRVLCNFMAYQNGLFCETCAHELYGIIVRGCVEEILMTGYHAHGKN